MTTSILPLRLGTARLGQYVEPGAEAPKRIKVHGECWELVTDPLLDIALVTENGSPAAQEAFAARLANILHLNVAHLFVTEGAVVNELVAERIAVAVARVIELDADRITSGQIDTARLNAAAIAAGVATVIQMDASRITSGQIDTARLRAQEVAAAVGSFLSLTADQITSGKIATGLLNAQEIATAVATIIELNASRITTGTLSANRIAANSITVAKILVNEELAAKVVQAMSVATKNLVVTDEAILNRATIINGLAADVVSAATIYASQLVVTALDKNGNLTSDSVGTVQIADGAVRAAQVHAEEVAGAIGRFLTIEVGQLTAGTADINSLVAQKIAGATADFQEAFIQNLRTNGAQIDDAVIGELAANIITSGFFRTAETGQRLEIDSNGVVMYGVDPDGVEYEMVRLGPSGENLVTVGSSTMSETGVAALHGSFDELQVAGQSIEELLWGASRGIVGIQAGVGISQWDGSGDEVRRLEVNAQMEAGRQYRVSYNTHYIQSRSALPGMLTEFLRWKNIDDGIGTSPGSPQLTSAIHWVQQSGWVAVPGGEALLQVPSTGRYQFMLFAKAVAGKDFRYNSEGSSPLRIVVEDVGPAVPAVTGYSWFHIGSPSQGAATPPPAPAPQEKRYTGVIWTPSGYGGDLSSGDIVQGTYSRFGDRSGSWTMPGDMRTALQGSTIELLEMELTNTHWYLSAGGTASLRATDGSAFKAFVGSAHTVPNWPRYQKRWVKIPATWYSYFQSGAWKGIGVQTASTSLTYYGRFAATGTRWRATYRK